jgi:methionine-rich copper-binding protein CopC
MKRILSCLALVALAVFTSGAFAQDQAPAQQAVVAQEPAPDQGPTLTSAEVKFDTTTDNKDQQTRLDVYMKTSHGHEVAKSEGNTGRWNKNSTHTVALQLEGNRTKEEVRDGSVSLTIHPQRNDSWDFNYKVTLKFSDGTLVTKDFHGCVLTNHDPNRTDLL